MSIDADDEAVLPAVRMEERRRERCGSRRKDGRRREEEDEDGMFSAERARQREGESRDE